MGTATTTAVSVGRDCDKLGRVRGLHRYVLFVCMLMLTFSATQPLFAADLEPLLAPGHPVNWWFVFKLNAAKFPGCEGNDNGECIFGGELKDYKVGQQFVYASSEQPALQKGSGCVGKSVKDPLGATVDSIYEGAFHYVIWNDQFYDDPHITGCTKNCPSPWGHSKGLVAWDDAGEGIVLQVTTPSWPAAGSVNHPRETDGNTLGCIGDNNVKVSQHFFALKLTKDDLIVVLKALNNASVVTDVTNPQVVSLGGPADIQKLARTLGKRSKSQTVTINTLSSNVQLISKPSALHVPPWQMVSALLGGVSLRTATWWANPQIPSTTTATTIDCWDDHLGEAGAVAIATTGKWDKTIFGLKGGPSADSNHAKIGVSTDSDEDYAIFGDLNQQGALSDKCASSQNGRGGLFFVLKDHDLWTNVSTLLKGKTAPKTLGQHPES